jgi:hypothetical protein
MNRNGNENGTWLVSLDDPHHGRRIVRAFERAIVADDRLFWTTTAGTLLTQRLDSSTGGLLGEPATVVTGVNNGGPQGLSAFSISSAGAIVFQGSSLPTTQLAWVARNGRMLESVSDVGFNLNPQLSPDGGRVAYVRREQGRSELWLVDVERHSSIRVLSEQTRVPIRDLFWSRDGSRIVYSSDRGPKATNLYVIGAAGGQATPYFEQPNDIYFYGWIPDAQTAIWEEQSDASRVTGQVGNRFAIKTMGPDRKPVTYFDPGYWILHTTVSPNGRWIAFSSDQSGRRDVFVIGFPEPGTPRQVSSAGGTQPRWRADGKELFFLSADSKLMAVSVNTVHGDVTFGRPEPLFDVPMRWWLNSLSTQYDVSRDGQRFLVDMVLEEHVAPLTVILNWPKLLQRR